MDEFLENFVFTRNNFHLTWKTFHREVRFRAGGGRRDGIKLIWGVKPVFTIVNHLNMLSWSWVINCQNSSNSAQKHFQLGILLSLQRTSFAPAHTVTHDAKVIEFFNPLAQVSLLRYSLPSIMLLRLEIQLPRSESTQNLIISVQF